jgi:hypothetical protein
LAGAVTSGSVIRSVTAGDIIYLKARASAATTANTRYLPTGLSIHYLSLSTAIVDDEVEILTALTELKQSWNDYRSLITTDVTVTAGSGWTITNVSAGLLGNILRMYATFTRSSDVSVGDITNENVCTVTFDTGGRVAVAQNTGFIATTAGGVTAFSTNGTTVDSDGNVTTTIKLNATTVAGKTFNVYPILHVTRID